MPVYTWFLKITLVYNISVHVFTCVCVCMRAYVHMFMGACVLACVRACVHMHVCAYPKAINN